MQYQAVIGLEVHVQGLTRTKMFCACANCYGQEPNTQVCPVCLGYPGAMPVMNAEAIAKTVTAGLMCGCTINTKNKFDRKSYYYPDMPKNYQISQYDLPICIGGGVRIGGKGFSGAMLPEKIVGLTRIHLEEDVAKLTHFGSFSVVDFNRAGVPLLEVVSEPQMHSADEAYAYLVALKQVMEYAGVSHCDMEKGQMRCDVNISVRAAGCTVLGTKIEIKNLNSIRAVHRSIDYEIARQIEALENGERLRQETRRWNDDSGMTSVMRVKEHAHDYRYFPEPDLMPLDLDDNWLQQIRASLPEAPWQRRLRFVQDYAITEYDAGVLTMDKAMADYFETAAKAPVNAKTVANWIITELRRELSERSLSIAELTIPPTYFSELVGLIEDKTISSKIGKTVFAQMIETGERPQAIVKAKGLVQVTDSSAIAGFVDAVIAANPQVIAEYKSGKEKALQFLVGQVMKSSRGKANPPLVIDLLKERLGEPGQ